MSANAINEDVGVHTKVSLNVRHRVVSPARIAERTASLEIRLGPLRRPAVTVTDTVTGPPELYQYGPLLSSARKKIAYRWIDFLRSTGEVESEVGVYTHSRRPLESRPYRSQEHHRQYSARAWHRARAGAK